jgi:hypothetical protein
VYLGEIAERRLRVDDVALTSTELNPGKAGAGAATTTVAIEVAPEDVVLLPHDTGGE